jgi:DNA topoisomerase-1
VEQALQLLSLPRTLGVAGDGGIVVARPGRFGPYLEKTIPGAEKPKTRSLKSEEDLLTITLDEAQALFAIPKSGRGRRAGHAPLRELGLDPASAAPVVLKDGRYGPYVTDGTTNASLAKGANIEQLTLEEAARLLAERREAGPPVKKRARARTAT